jgi:hypothetical protein
MDRLVIDTLSLPVYPLLYQPLITYRHLSFDTYISLIPSLEGKPTLDLVPYVNPVEWSKTSKGFTLCLSYITATSSTYAAGSYSPSARAMSEEWHVSIVKILLSITTFCIRYAIALIVFAPFNEIKGRYPMFLGAGIVYLSAQICCVITGSYFRMLF